MDKVYQIFLHLPRMKVRVETKEFIKNNGDKCIPYPKESTNRKTLHNYLQDHRDEVLRWVTYTMYEKILSNMHLTPGTVPGSMSFGEVPKSISEVEDKSRYVVMWFGSQGPKVKIFEGQFIKGHWTRVRVLSGPRPLAEDWSSIVKEHREVFKFKASLILSRELDLVPVPQLGSISREDANPEMTKLKAERLPEVIDSVMRLMEICSSKMIESRRALFLTKNVISTLISLKPYFLTSTEIYIKLNRKVVKLSTIGFKGELVLYSVSTLYSKAALPSTPSMDLLLSLSGVQVPLTSELVHKWTSN